MANRQSHYKKEISWSRRIFQKTDIVRESVIDRKLTLNLLVIFTSFTDISFLKYVTKIFCIPYYFQEKIWECFKVQLLVAVSVYILSSKGANQLQVLYIKTMGKIQGNFLHAILFYLRYSPQMYSQQYFSENLQKFWNNISKPCSGKLCLSISYSR